MSGKDVELQILRQGVALSESVSQLGVVTSLEKNLLWQTRSNKISHLAVTDNKRYSPFWTVWVTLQNSHFYLMIDGDTGEALMASKVACLAIGEGYTCGKILYTKDWKLVANDKNGLPNPDQDYRALLSKYEPEIPWADDSSVATSEAKMPSPAHENAK